MNNVNNLPSAQKTDPYENFLKKKNVVLTWVHVLSIVTGKHWFAFFLLWLVDVYSKIFKTKLNNMWEVKKHYELLNKQVYWIFIKVVRNIRLNKVSFHQYDKTKKRFKIIAKFIGASLSRKRRELLTLPPIDELITENFQLCVWRMCVRACVIIFFALSLSLVPLHNLAFPLIHPNLIINKRKIFNLLLESFSSFIVHSLNFERINAIILDFYICPGVNGIHCLP